MIKLARIIFLVCVSHCFRIFFYFFYKPWIMNKVVFKHGNYLAEMRKTFAYFLKTLKVFKSHLSEMIILFGQRLSAVSFSITSLRVFPIFLSHFYSMRLPNYFRQYMFETRRNNYFLWLLIEKVSFHNLCCLYDGG